MMVQVILKLQSAVSSTENFLSFRMKRSDKECHRYHSQYVKHTVLPTLDRTGVSFLADHKKAYNCGAIRPSTVELLVGTSATDNLDLKRVQTDFLSINIKPCIWFFSSKKGNPALAIFGLFVDEPV